MHVRQLGDIRGQQECLIGMLYFSAPNLKVGRFVQGARTSFIFTRAVQAFVILLASVSMIYGQLDAGKASKARETHESTKLIVKSKKH